MKKIGLVLWSDVLMFGCAVSSATGAYALAFPGKYENILLLNDLTSAMLVMTDWLVNLGTYRKQAAKEVLSFGTKKQSPLKKLLTSYSLWVRMFFQVSISIPWSLVGGYHWVKMFSFVIVLDQIQRLKKMNSFFRRERLLVIGLYVGVIVHTITCFWIFLYPEPNLPLSSAYIKGFYWAITTLTTTGYGDVVPTTDAGRLFNVTVMLLGFSTFGLIVGSISSMIVSKNRHEEAGRQKMEELLSFLEYYSIPKKLRDDVTTFYSHIISKRLVENDTQLIADLPLALQKELRVYLKIKLIKALPIFHDTPIECLKLISQKLTEVSFSQGESVIKKGDHGDEMFIIAHGEIEVRGDDHKVVAHLGHGQCFGEIALMKDTTRTANVFATNYCDLYVLKKDDFKEIIKVFPDLNESFKHIVLRRSGDKTE